MRAMVWWAACWLVGCGPAPGVSAPQASSAPVSASSPASAPAQPAAQADPEALPCARTLVASAAPAAPPAPVALALAPAPRGRGAALGDLGEVAVVVGKGRPVTELEVALPPMPSAAIRGGLAPETRPLWERWGVLRDRALRRDRLRLLVERAAPAEGDEARCLRDLRRGLAQSKSDDGAAVSEAGEALVAGLEQAPDGAARSFVLAYLGAERDAERGPGAGALALARRAAEAEPASAALGAYARLWAAPLAPPDEARRWLREVVEQQRDASARDTARIWLAAAQQGDASIALLRDAAREQGDAGPGLVALWRLAAAEIERGRWEPALRALERFAGLQRELDRNFSADIGQQIVAALALAPADARVSLALPPAILHQVAEQLSEPISGAPIATARAALAATPASSLVKAKARLGALAGADEARESLHRLLLRCATPRAAEALRLELLFDGKGLGVRASPAAPEIERCLRERAASLAPSGPFRARGKLSWASPRP